MLVPNHCLIVFSKDRPDRLLQTLSYLNGLSYPIYLIDDSMESINREVICKLCNDLNIKYHGQYEQKEIINSIGSMSITDFTGVLGQQKWNLGLNRNYAIIYSLFLGYDKVIFMDDDVICDHRIIDDIITNLEIYPFVGSEITNMPDHSIIGHIYRACGNLLPQYVSGTFLGIDLSKIAHYFLNEYNEDWIWLFLENNGQYIHKIGQVKQLKFNPLQDWKSKILFQEVGEILWDGLYYFQPPKRSDLITTDFWVDVLEIRKKEIKEISSFILPDQISSMAIAMQDYVLQFHKNLLPSFFAGIFYNYFNKVEEWQYVVSSVKNIAGQTQVCGES